MENDILYSVREDVKKPSQYSGWPVLVIRGSVVIKVNSLAVSWIFTKLTEMYANLLIGIKNSESC